MGFPQCQLNQVFPWGKTSAFAKFPAVSDTAESHGSELAFTITVLFINWVYFSIMSVCFSLNADVAWCAAVRGLLTHTACMLTSDCQEIRVLPSIGCSTAAICGQEKKLLLSSESLLYARGAVICGLLNMTTWIDIISYFMKPAERTWKVKPGSSWKGSGNRS